jgi:hypothetical protein
MNTELEFDKRISVLEKSMEWAQGSIQNINRNLEIIKNGQFQMLERFMEYKTDTIDRISSLQVHTDERFSALQAHTDEKFIAVHTEISSIHHAISLQTKWLLTVILAASALISVIQPVMMKLLKMG